MIVNYIKIGPNSSYVFFSSKRESIQFKGFLSNINNDNTSRRLFDDPEIFSRITGVNQELIKRFKVIFEVTSSGCDVKLKRYVK